MKLAIFQRSTSETRPDAHVIAVRPLVTDRQWLYFTDHQSQHIMEQVGMNLKLNGEAVVIPFGDGESVLATKGHADQLVKDLQFALQEWADYVNG